MTTTKAVRYAVASLMVAFMAGFCLGATPSKPENVGAKAKPECTLVGLTFNAQVTCNQGAGSVPQSTKKVLVFQANGTVLIDGEPFTYIQNPMVKGKSCTVGLSINDWSGPGQTFNGKVTGTGLKSLTGHIVAFQNNHVVVLCKVVGKKAK